MSGVAPLLDAVASITNYSSPARPTYLIQFVGGFISLVPLTTPPSVSFLGVSPLSFCNTRYPHPLPAWYVVQLDVSHPCHSTASAAHICAVRLLLLQCPASVRPTFAAFGLRPGPCWPLGVRLSLVYPYTFFPCLYIPV